MKESSTCGFFGLHPKWMKNFGTTRNFVAVYSLLGTAQAMAFIYIIVTLTTIEKRFKIPSRTTGIMLSGNEISQIMAVVLTYFGGSGHRPRWIALGVVLSALSCFVLALPHFVYGPGKDALALTKEYRDNILSNSTVKLPMCPHSGNLQCDEESEEDVSIVPRLLVFLSQFILGIGTTLYYGLGLPYIDDNTKKKNTPMVLGLTFALRTVGPVIGFVLGWACLRLYIDPSLHPVIDKDDPRWLGAWWLGWIILGVTMAMFAVLMAMFPRDPIKSKVAKKEKEQISMDELALNEKIKSVEPAKAANTDKPTLSNFPKACKRILCNKLLSCNNCSTVFYILGASAYMTFLAKYLEVQYNTSPGGGTVIAGPITLFGTVMGFLLSGHLISKYKPGSRLLLGWNVFVGFLFICGQVSFIFLDCPAIKLQGLDPETMQMNTTSPCNVNCYCESVKYNPVCHEPTMTTFFSACHAGCTKVLNDKEFGDCSCVNEVIFGPTSSKDIYSIAGSETRNLVKSGLCESECKTAFVLFTIITCVIQILGSSGRIGNVLVNYRCVAVEDKSFAQGIAIMIISLFALIPGPIIYGAIIDSTCLIWDQSCGTRGNCWLYDKTKFRYFVNITAAGLTSIGVLFDVLVCYLGKNLDLYGNDEESDKRRDFVQDEFPNISNDSKRKCSGDLARIENVGKKEKEEGKEEENDSRNNDEKCHDNVNE